MYAGAAALNEVVALGDNGEDWLKLLERAKRIRELKISEVEIGVSRALSHLLK